MSNLLGEQRTCLYDGAAFDYRLDARGYAHIVRCHADSSRICIPELCDGHAVAGLDDGSFARLTCAERVVCPTTLESIGTRAFEGCLHLSQVTLNEGLCEIGEEAFFLCPALAQLYLPATLRHVGANAVGTRGGWSQIRREPASTSIHPDNGHLFYDEAGVLYERSGDGCMLVDGSRHTGPVLTCHPETRRIGARALAQLPELERIVLPYGLVAIGDEAFRGCVNLREAPIPETLQSIGFAAFSCTAIESLRLPAGCVDLDENALAMGPITREGGAAAFRHSSLTTIDVDWANPYLRTCEQVVCRRRDDGRGFEAFAAPSAVGHVKLDANVTRICAGAFAGTSSIESLTLHEGIELPNASCAVASATCGAIAVETATGEILEFIVPSGEPGRAFLHGALSGGAVNLTRIAHAYDKALAQMRDGLEQAQLAVARLARPSHLSPAARTAFEEFLGERLDAVCAAFGERNYWTGFDQLADAGLLDTESVPHVVNLLSRLGHTQAVGHVLALTRQRGAGGWDDYEL